jgi:PAS domain S-box-containing protein
VRDRHGNIKSWVGINLDITERKQSEEDLRASEERYRAFFENSLDGIFITVPDGRVVSANPAACDMLGMTEEEICKLGREGIVDSTDSRLPGLVEERSRIRKARGELTFVRKDGLKFPVEASSAIFKDKQGDDANIIIFRDITERKQLEEELRRSHDELEVRVQERTAELTLALESSKTYAARLELLNNELQEFAFVASHDLQEPLRKVQAFGDRLRNKCESSLGEEGCDYLRRMESAANRMSSLLSALLSYSRVATRGQPFAPVTLVNVAKEVVDDLEIAIEDTGARVEIGPLPTLEADADQMRQLLHNLVGNALRYRREGEKPQIRVYGSSENDVVQIFVEDNGIGFDEKYLDRIFKPFQQLHGRSSSYEGTGMGLAIVRKIVERHGGTITARSTPGEGSTFIVILPMKQRGSQDEPPMLSTYLDDPRRL